MSHLVQLVKRRYCRPLVIWARDDSDRFLRVGMSILIEAYPYLDVAQATESYFVWYISAADSDVLRAEFRMSEPPALGRVLLDNAIVLAQNAGLGGRIGLHPAAAGGRALLNVYAACGLTRLAATAPLAPGVKRQSDGRFFVADETQAEVLAALLDPSR